MKFIIEIFIAIMLLVFVAPKVEMKIKSEVAKPNFKSELHTKVVKMKEKIPKGAEIPKQ